MSPNFFYLILVVLLSTVLFLAALGLMTLAVKGLS